MFVWRVESAPPPLDLTERHNLLPPSANKIPSTFFNQLRSAAESALLLDYDGTLAPFQTDRDRAYPYPEVMPLLERILISGRSKVAIVSGRTIADLRPFLDQLPAVEIWGSHGIEHLSADGVYSQTEIPVETTNALANAVSRLTASGLAHRTEIKPGGIAVHWRGLSTDATKAVYTATHECLRPLIHHPGLKLLSFEGGVELRVIHPNKGDAVSAILNRCDPLATVAYLGDDHTDEAAFRVLNPYGLTILVRHEYRATNAQFWLHPPHQLIHFLQTWADCVGA